MAKSPAKVQPRIPNQQAHVQPVVPVAAPVPALKTVEEMLPGESMQIPEELLTGTRQLEQLLRDAQAKLGAADMAVAEAESRRHESRVAVKTAHSAWVERCTSVCKVLGAESSDNTKGWNLNTDKGTLTRTR